MNLEGSYEVFVLLDEACDLRMRGEVTPGVHRLGSGRLSGHRSGPGARRGGAFRVPAGIGGSVRGRGCASRCRLGSGPGDVGGSTARDDAVGPASRPDEQGLMCRGLLRRCLKQLRSSMEERFRRVSGCTSFDSVICCWPEQTSPSVPRWLSGRWCRNLRRQRSRFPAADLSDHSHTLSALIGRPATTLSDVVETALA